MERAQPLPVSHKKRGLTLYGWKEAIWGYLFILPNFLLMLVFTMIPVFFAFGVSLTDWSLLSAPNFVGIENYVRIFQDPVAQITIKNTLFFTAMSVPLRIIFPLLLAVALNQKIRGLAVYRTCYYLPVISASVAVSVLFLWILDTNYGLLNRFLVTIGLNPVGWLTNPRVAMISIVIVTVWRGLGFNMIIFLAALQEVPEDLYEAAAIDGASGLQKFFRLTVPLISPSIFFLIITGVIDSFQSFDLVYNMTDGGPARSTHLIGFYIWRRAFDYLQMGYGAALAYLLFFGILLVTILQWIVRKHWVYGEQ
ncbi:MAG: carbohydrate ABC transporter permease [Brevefilum sp.]